MLKNKFLYLLLSFIISAVLIFVLLSRIETEDLVQTFKGIYYPSLFIFMVIALTGAVLRAWRYKWLLKPQTISWGNIFLVTLIRNLFVDLLPARLGSLSYIYFLNKRLNYSFEAAASSFVVAIVFDFLTLSPFLVVAIFIVGLGSTAVSSVTLLIIALIFFIFLFVVLWKIIPLFSILLRVYQRALKAFKFEEKKWAQISVEKITLTIDSLSQIKEKKIYGPVFFLSLSIRLAKYTSLYFLLFSLLRGHGFLLRKLSFWKTILGITGAELSSALPIKGIAGFGTWESAWAIAFQLMDFEQRLAILSGIGVHLLTNLFEYSLGIMSILILAFPVLKRKRGKKS
jgi:uncharacterized membrane protein YbhN (UPF0104 family)